MLTMLLGYIYGVGFGLSIVGGALYFMVLNGLRCQPSLPKFILGVIFWPIGWVAVAIKLYKLYKEG